MTIDRDSGGFAVLAGGLLLAAAMTPAAAADASPWAADARSAVRLIAGSAPANAAPLRAGIEIKLQPGWKTYWRYPGDAGVPPKFDFAASENVAGVTVLYPAPHLFTDESGASIGYKDRVILPLRVVPRQAGKPATLRLALDFAVCEKLCVPVQANAELMLSGGPSGEEGSLAAAEARVPKPVEIAGAGALAIRSVRRITDGPRSSIQVDVTAPADASVELFAEGPSPQWALPVPQSTAGAPAGQRRFSFDLDGLPPGTDPKSPFDLTLTAVAGDQAVEVKTHLD